MSFCPVPSMLREKTPPSLSMAYVRVSCFTPIITRGGLKDAWETQLIVATFTSLPALVPST